MIERELGTGKTLSKLCFVVIPETKYKQQEPAEQVLNRKVEKATHWHVAFFIAYSGRGFSGKRRRTSTKNSGTK